VGWREAGIALVVGGVILAVSVLLSPVAWRDWVSLAMSRGPGDVASFLPIPYLVRAVAGLVLALAAGRLPERWRGPGLVVAVTVALPTLWFTALSLLIAIVPLWRWSGAGGAADDGPGLRLYDYIVIYRNLLRQPPAPACPPPHARQTESRPRRQPEPSTPRSILSRPAG
jgi:hypothetical protein